MRLFQIILNISCKVYFYLEINFSESAVWISKNSSTYSITASSLHWISTQLEKKPNKYDMVIFSLSCLFLTYMYHHSERKTYKNVYFSTIYILHVLVCLYFIKWEAMTPWERHTYSECSQCLVYRDSFSNQHSPFRCYSIVPTEKKVIQKFTVVMSSSPLCSGLGNLTLSPILLKFDCLSTHHPKL